MKRTLILLAIFFGITNIAVSQFSIEINSGYGFSTIQNKYHTGGKKQVDVYNQEFYITNKNEKSINIDLNRGVSYNLNAGYLFFNKVRLNIGYSYFNNQGNKRNVTTNETYYGGYVMVDSALYLLNLRHDDVSTATYSSRIHTVYSSLEYEYKFNKLSLSTFIGLSLSNITIYTNMEISSVNFYNDGSIYTDYINNKRRYFGNNQLSYIAGISLSYNLYKNFDFLLRLKYSKLTNESYFVNKAELYYSYYEIYDVNGNLLNSVQDINEDNKQTYDYFGFFNMDYLKPSVGIRYTFNKTKKPENTKIE